VKAVVAAGAVVAGGMLALEVVMHPSRGDRLEPLVLFIAMAVLTLIGARVFPTLSRRASSLSRTVAAVGLVVVGLVALAITIGAWRMFLSVHDLHLLSIVLVVAASLGVLFALSVSRSLKSDLVALGRTAERVAADDLDARTNVVRNDELGATAAAFDAMIERLADAEQQRRHDDRSRRALLAAISHDLRTPLSALQAAIEALQDGLAPDPDRYLRSMSYDVEHLRALVDDLFLLARIEAGELALEREPVDLAELADETIEALEPVATRRHVGLCLETTGQVLVHGGPTALGRVMRNLLDNAIRHAPATSDVIVRVENGDAAVVQIQDQGPGFDPAHLAVAFDVFTRADPSRSRQTGGAGLGLAIAKGVIEAHGGTIWAEAGPGGRVTFHLPAVR
jgi:signal transduction histidine kinase